MVSVGSRLFQGVVLPGLEQGSSSKVELFSEGFVKIGKSRGLFRIKAMEGSKKMHENQSRFDEKFSNGIVGSSGRNPTPLSSVGNSTNIKWHRCSVEKGDREKLLKQKGCVIWITGLSSSGKSSVACALSKILQKKGKLSYILDGDNLRHGLNRDLSFKAEDRTENIRRVGEVARMFSDAGVICIASLISPYRGDRDACRALLPDGDFIEVFMDVPLHVCEARDPKGLYKLARAGKIKGFTGVDDPYELPLNCEIVLEQGEDCETPVELAERIVLYLEEKGYLQV